MKARPFAIQRIAQYALILLLILPLSCSSGGGSEGGGSDGGGDGGSDGGSGIGQIARCGTADPDEGSLSNIATLFRNFLSSSKYQYPLQTLLKDSTVEIPVVFHVVSKGDGVANGELPDDAIAAQVDVLNNEYSGGNGSISTPFRFRLSAINRVRKPEWYTIAPGSEVEIAMKEALKRGGPETLNVYSVNTEGGILGYSTLPFLYGLVPQIDGIVINFRTFPGQELQRYNIGNVLVHEVGHWLGLFHTFQGGCSGFFDDLVSDTPREKQPGKGEFCPSGRDSCPEVQGQDPIHNHMTYTEDSCRSEFTAGQLDFMKFNTNFFRGFNL